MLFFFVIACFVCLCSGVIYWHVYGYYDRFFIASAAAIVALVFVSVAVYLHLIVRRLEGRLHVIITMAARENIDLLSVLGTLIELRDSDTSGHNLRVSVYAVLFAEAMNLTAAEVVQFVKGAYLHDIGKLVIPDNILKKPEALTHEERCSMEQHVVRGIDIAEEAQYLMEALPVISSHHEKYDGSGYPSGLKGNEIPLMGRMFAIIDVFDALTSTRAYKKPIAVNEAIQIMQKSRGTHFDPFLYDQFSKLIQHQAKKLPTDEVMLMEMLIDHLTPFLDLFLLKEALAANRINLNKRA